MFFASRRECHAQFLDFFCFFSTATTTQSRYSSSTEPICIGFRTIMSRMGESILWSPMVNFGPLVKKFTIPRETTSLSLFVLRALPTKFTATIPDSEHAKCSRAWGKLLRSRQPIFQLSMWRDKFCTHSFVLTSSVGLEQYQFENHISSDSDH
jgi:hypothetical protein